MVEPRIKDAFPLASKFSVVFMFFLIAIPMIYSFIVAFMILDERDEHLLTVLRVMPISRNYIPVALLFALFTPLIALLVSSYASNKVQAFAIFKIGGTVFMLPIFVFFLNLGDLKYIFSPVPNFWSLLALDSVIQNGAIDIVPLGIGFAFHIALIAVLFYIFNKKN
jgi:hypothetical protein